MPDIKLTWYTKHHAPWGRTIYTSWEAFVHHAGNTICIHRFKKGRVYHYVVCGDYADRWRRKTEKAAIELAKKLCELRAAGKSATSKNLGEECMWVTDGKGIKIGTS